MTENHPPALSLLACQLHIPAITSVEERALHLQQTATKIRTQLSRVPAQLVVLPELSSIDYTRKTFDKLAQLSEAHDGASFQVFSPLAREFGITIVYGYPGRSGDKFTICQAAVGSDGQLIGMYEKLHLAQYGASMEKDYFERGRELLVFNLEGVRIAPIICYDIRFPGLCQTLATDHEVDLILHCGAYYRDESFASWPHFVITRAMENQCYVLSLNRAGENYGASMLCPPWMDENHPCEKLDSNAEEFRYFSIKTRNLARARRYPFKKDRLSNYTAIPLRKY
jgi:predicted amidohydrolase